MTGWKQLVVKKLVIVAVSRRVKAEELSVVLSAQ
jgi:hypothetical protein